MARSVDYTALTAPVTSEQVRTFRQQALRDPAYSSQFGVARVVVLVFVFVVIGFLFLGFAGVIVSMVASSAAQGLTITTAVSLL
ncbi:MAG TPA: hypothetical protein PLU61_12600, partial [Rhodoglobus sp.]|nr:hypothetical protein [Rhodoglobus sp.]